MTGCMFLIVLATLLEERTLELRRFSLVCMFGRTLKGSVWNPITGFLFHEAKTVVKNDVRNLLRNTLLLNNLTFLSEKVLGRTHFFWMLSTPNYPIVLPTPASLEPARCLMFS